MVDVYSHAVSIKSITKLLEHVFAREVLHYIKEFAQIAILDFLFSMVIVLLVQSIRLIILSLELVNVILA